MILAVFVIPLPALVSILDEADSFSDPGSAGWSAAFQFLPQKILGSVMPDVGLVLAGAGVGVHYFRKASPGHSGQHAETGWAAVAIGLMLTGAGYAEAVWLSTLSPLPDLVVTGEPRVHLGHEATFEATISGGEDPSEWRTGPVTVKGETAGPQERTLTARRFLATVERRHVFEVGADDGDPLFPLAVGNHWTYVGSAEWHDHVLWFIDTGRKLEDPHFTLAVKSEDASGPLHVYELERIQAGSDPVVYEVFNWNGRAMVEGQGELVTRVDPASQDPGSGLAAPADPRVKTVLCRFALFPGCMCRCLSGPAPQASLAGPLQCTKVESENVGALKALASTFIGLATAGMLIPDFSADRKWELVESGDGPLPPPAPGLPAVPVEVPGDTGGDEQDAE